MNAGPVTPAVRKWAERGRPGAQVTGYTLRPLDGGAVARSVDQVTLHLTGGHSPLELVRKQAPAHEIAGLRAAQAVRAQTAAVPELIAWGRDWLMTPLGPGAPLAWGDPAPAALFDALAVLHARYLGAAGLPAVIPRITPGWWQSLCREWVEPQLREHAGRHPAQTAAALEPGYRWAASRSLSSTCPGRSRTGPPATPKPPWTASSKPWPTCRPSPATTCRPGPPTTCRLSPSPGPARTSPHPVRDPDAHWNPTYPLRLSCHKHP